MRTHDQRLLDRAVTLFNAGAFFEAHEDWETLWNDAQGEERLWLQGLIQWAAAFVHHDRGYHASGFTKLMREAHEKAAAYEGDTWGLRFDRFLDDLAPWQAHAERVAAGADLVRDAPPRLPRLAYEAGIAPDPLDVEPED